MVRTVLDELTERGFVAQMTDPEGVAAYLRNPAPSCYIGFDPTADSLHVGSLVPILALVHMQRNGCRPIVLVGGGTGLVGDPSGKTEMRKLLGLEEIRSNAAALQKQLDKIRSNAEELLSDSPNEFSKQSALFLNNVDWLAELRYIEFLRDIGKHFSVNRMIAAESYKQRLETGLSFIEFNYMLLQAYDFLYLSERHDCFLQMGGNDQWGNIVAGIELIRRKNGKNGLGITFPLTTTASGAKMGKTASGAVWLDAERTKPFDFYQYWVNTDDLDVARFLKLYTFLPVGEIEAIGGLEGRDLNACKSILAYEVTSIVHGSDAALAVLEAARRQFRGRDLPEDLLPSSKIPRTVTNKAVRDAMIAIKTGQSESHVSEVSGIGNAFGATPAGQSEFSLSEISATGNTQFGFTEGIPATVIDSGRLSAGIHAYELFAETGLCASRSAARRLIQQGGAYVNEERIADTDLLIGSNHLRDGEILLKAGKKKVHRVVGG